MDMMKALVYEKPGRANGHITMIPKPVCGDNEVLMKVMACAICKPAESSHDRTTGSLMGKYPATPGHEFAGIAEEVGKNVTDIKVGDYIIADNAYPCGHCYYCKSNRPMMCENYRCQGHNMQGGFAQYMVCKSDNVFSFSKDIPFDKACMSELVNCASSAVNYAELKYGENVAVFGCGSSGNLIAQLMKNSNAGTVVALDTVQSKLDRIKPYGIETILVDPEDFSKHEAVLKEMFPHGIDVIVDAVGDDGPLLESNMKLLSAGGRLMVYSFFYFEPKTFHVDPGLMIRKGLKLIGCPLQGYNFGNCIHDIELGKVDTGAIIDTIYPLDDYFIALDRVLNEPGSMKMIIHPND